ncbi:putative methyltransferase [Acetobacter nitrogenifigens DSM 23921 = NBRC 105050]|uniref:Methyltransferase n=1 Tax=Acetobacter nitrogenifigens DSM 23921 = NBRC 105050 TaxID=1120919 RepID=A0A511X807_9PROT|nr:methyltransferase [Acetobacter nitrogenifigens]GBQ89167.1 putative methyltransferase [Acetobacter nitrogenifigens DSM 23921 = NBRC 105050]GEN59080.1 methyltransferase [Acetobacter nitrogenifigens DSM 23921 = NBRC 105050]
MKDHSLRALFVNAIAAFAVSTPLAYSATVTMKGLSSGPAAAIEAAVHAPTRSPKFLARDATRHPADELSFFGIKPDSSVVEIWPGGGYWTQILAPLLHDKGAYYLAMGNPAGDEVEAEFALTSRFKAMLDAEPGVYDRVKITKLGAHDADIAPPGSVDFVLTFRNLHNWMDAGDAQLILAAIRRALKNGGYLCVEDHRGSTATEQDPQAKNGYVRQDYAIRLIETAGFRLVASSEIDANPRDTADWPKGVWTLPPTLVLGDTDRAKYEAIGEADNFVLKFQKVGG